MTISEGDHDGRVVRWSLPASKTDTEARGVARAHGCSCSVGAPASCPFCAVVAQLARLQTLFPHRWAGGVADADLPLFPTLEGAVVTKDRMAATIVEAAKRLKVPLASADRSARVSGHSLRVTGAQGLARAGVDVWAIQLLGRWGSSAVLEYIREVPLELATPWRRPPGFSRPQTPRPRSSSASPRPLAAQRPVRAHGWFHAVAPRGPRAPTRSRSPPPRRADYDEAFPPLRSDAPGRLAHGRGVFPSLSSAAL